MYVRNVFKNQDNDRQSPASLCCLCKEEINTKKYFKIRGLYSMHNKEKKSVLQFLWPLFYWLERKGQFKLPLGTSWL